MGPDKRGKCGGQVVPERLQQVPVDIFGAGHHGYAVQAVGKRFRRQIDDRLFPQLFKFRGSGQLPDEAAGKMPEKAREGGRATSGSQKPRKSSQESGFRKNAGRSPPASAGCFG